MESTEQAPGISRRAAVTGVVALTGGVLVGCQTYGGPGESPAPETSPAEGGTSTPPAEGGTSEAPAAGGIAKTADIPLGGGKVFADRKVVITQPKAGTFKGFSAVCTHQGCTVGEVAGGTINCPCHGSKFAIADGSVAGGPAQRPLPARALSVKGDQISLG